jgi:ribonuclease HII
MTTINENTRVVEEMVQTLDGLVKSKVISEKKRETIKTNLLTHQQMISKMLKNSTVKAEVDKLNLEEFAILNEIL